MLGNLCLCLLLKNLYTENKAILAYCDTKQEHTPIIYLGTLSNDDFLNKTQINLFHSGKGFLLQYENTISQKCQLLNILLYCFKS